MIGIQRQRISVKAVLFPACTCGHAYPGHGCHAAGCVCTRYEPTRPFEYRLSHSVSFLRRLICQSLWTIERRAEAWRISLEGSH